MENKDLTKQEEKALAVPKVEYSEKEIAYRDFLIDRLTAASNQRNAEHSEFNEMNYYTWCEENAKTANSYTPPKKNKGDTRIVTGTTQEKVVTLLSALLNYNLEPNIEPFDKFDMPIRELGENMEDMVRKSRTMEIYDDKKVLIYKELLDQGTCFIEEQWVESIMAEKEISELKWSEGVKVEDIDWKTKFKDTTGKCEVNLLTNTQVYLGNIKEFEMDKQPFIFFHDIISYEEAKSIYQNWDRWQYVPRKIRKLQTETDNNLYEDWTMQEMENDMVEVIKYQDKWTNEFMIIVNGVMMLPIEFPLTAISPSGEYTIVKGIAEPIRKSFAYGKSTPAKTQTDQAVLDEFLKLMILKTRKSFMPPLANLSSKIISKDIFLPGTITSDIEPNALQPIGEANGVTPAEFSAFEMIKKIIDEKTVSPSFSGQQTTGQQTATEIMELKKQQMMKLGLLVVGVVNMERKLAWLRIQNILANWTKPIDTEVDNVKKGIKDVYRTITAETTLDNGQKGQRMIKFDTEMPNQITTEQVKAEEDFLSEPDKQVKITYIHPKELAKIKATWYINITPTEKSSGELDMVMYKQNLNDATILFGREAINWENAKVRWAVLSKEDPDKFFNKNAPPMLPMEGQEPVGGKIGQEIGASVKQPALNQMLK